MKLEKALESPLDRARDHIWCLAKGTATTLLKKFAAEERARAEKLWGEVQAEVKVEKEEGKETSAIFE